MVAPAFRAAGAQFAATNATTAARPAGTAADDFELFVSETSNEPLPAMSGWLGIGSGSINVAVTSVTALTARYQFAVGGDTAATVPDSGDHQVGRMFGISGVDTASPFDGTPVFSTDAGTSTTVNFPTLTTTGPDRLIVHVVVSGFDTSTSQVTGAGTNAALTGLANRGNGWVVTGLGGGYAVITGVKATAGAIGTTTVTHTTTGHPRALLTFALKPPTSTPATATPAAIATTTTIPAPVIPTDRTVTPATIATAVAVPAPTQVGPPPFTVAPRHVGKGNSVQTQATNSTTPTASSLLLVGAACQNDGHTTAQAWTVSGGSLTYTQIAKSADVAWGATATNFALSATLQRATVGASPSAFAVTADAYTGTQIGNYDIQALDVTGHDTSNPIAQSKANGATIGSGGNPSDTGTGSVTLDAAPAAGNLLVVYIGIGNDGVAAPASPTAGVGKTFTAASTSSSTFCAGGLWYRICDGSESATISCADVGQQVGNYGMVAVEVAKAAAGGTPATATPATIATTAGVAAPTVSTGTRTTATVVATATALPAPTVRAGASTQAASIATVAAVPAVTPSTGSNATPAPSTIATVAAVPVPSPSTGPPAPAAVIATAATVPGPTIAVGASTQAAAIATVASVPAPTLSVGSNAFPTVATIATVSAVGVSTVATGSAAAAVVVATVAALPTPTLRTGSAVTATAIATAAAMPAPAVTAGGNATINATAITTVAAVPAAGVSAGQRTAPAAIVTSSTLPAPTVRASSTTTPAAIVTTTAVGASAASVGSRVTVTTVGTVTALPGPAVTAEKRVLPGAIATTTAMPSPLFSVGSRVTVAAIATAAQIGAALVVTPAFGLTFRPDGGPSYRPLAGVTYRPVG